MFTGLVQHVGELVSRESRAGGARLEIAAPGLVPELAPGDSVAVDGTCLTVTGLRAGSFSVDAVATTLGRTTLGELAPGRRVNLERAVRAGEPLGGHIVQGHVDGIGEVVEARAEDDGRVLRVRLPPEVAEYTVERGSLTVDGISLTVAGLSDGVAKLAIIPYICWRLNVAGIAAASVGVAALGTGIGFMQAPQFPVPDEPIYNRSLRPPGVVMVAVGAITAVTGVLVIVAGHATHRKPRPETARVQLVPGGLRW